MRYEVKSKSPEDTKAVAGRLSEFLRGGEVIELSSDLGGGKTTFVQGLAAGLGCKDTVTSPTFTLSRIYDLPSGRSLHHYDLYRLGESGVVGTELSEDIADKSNITVVEWAGIVDSDLPRDRLQVDFVMAGDSSRELIFKSSGPVSDHLIRKLEGK